MADERITNDGAKIASIIDKTKIWFSFYLFLTDKHKNQYDIVIVALWSEPTPSLHISICNPFIGNGKNTVHLP